jgi:hypothetical protein
LNLIGLEENKVMTSTLKKILVSSIAIGFFTASSAFAAGKTYTEDEFLDNFSGKTKKVISEKLGSPAKKELSVKPTNAGEVTGKNVDDKSSKPVKVEMWYYKNIVKYDPKRTYKETEITFVNDRVMNIAFFNNR